jgi:predicted nucleic acid-binding Zn ribbon protein
MKHLEDKRHCPHCGNALHEQRYLMSRDPDAELSDGMRQLGKVGLVVIAALVLAFLIHVARAHGVPI